MARKEKWLTPPLVIALLGVIGQIFGVIPKIIPYFQQPDVRYSTNELAGYPVPYHDNKPVPGDIQGKVLARGLVQYLTVVVWSEGQSSVAGVTVRIPYSKEDDLISGWMTDSANPSKAYLLGKENALPKLIPGDKVTFYLTLGNVNSDLAGRIKVDAGRRLATYYQYVAVPYVSSSVAFIVPVKKSWLFVFGFAVATLLLGILWMRRRRQPATTETLADAAEELSTSSPASRARSLESRDSPPSGGAAGGG